MLRLIIDEHIPLSLGQAVVAFAEEQGFDLDLVNVRDVGLDHTPDQVILEWAASEGRVVVTADVNTLVGFAYDRVRAGLPMAGVLVLRREVGTGASIEHLAMAACVREPGEMNDRVRNAAGESDPWSGQDSRCRDGIARFPWASLRNHRLRLVLLGDEPRYPSAVNVCDVGEPLHGRTLTVYSPGIRRGIIGRGVEKP